MKKVNLLLLFLVVKIGYSQVVFLETFDELDNAVVGVDNSGGAVGWTATCPGSVAVDDYFKVLAGQLEGKDTNGPGAAWETGLIDISACPGINISMVMTELSNMEECIDCGGTGATCIDWVKLEYNLDGGGWTDVPGVTCALIESPGEMIQIGDIVGGGPVTYSSPCIDFGTTLQIRVSCMCWAAAEIWKFDNITVSCLDCILPVEVVNLKAIETTQGVLVSWSTLTERSSDYFTVERSVDGQQFDLIKTLDGAGNSSQKMDYSVLDTPPQPNGIIYYRVKQYDLDGKNTFSEIRSVFMVPKSQVSYANQQLNYSFNWPDEQPLTLNVFAINGQLVGSYSVQNAGSIPWLLNGLYLVEIPELNFRQKIAVPH